MPACSVAFAQQLDEWCDLCDLADRGHMQALCGLQPGVSKWDLTIPLQCRSLRHVGLEHLTCFASSVTYERMA